jgi:hypothetical protein
MVDSRARCHDSIGCVSPNCLSLAFSIPRSGRDLFADSAAARNCLGHQALDETRERLVNNLIEERYLTRSRPNVEELCRIVHRRCIADGLKPVSRNAVRARINRLVWELRAARRFLAQRGETRRNQERLFWAHEELTRIAAEAMTETRRVRRHRERRSTVARERSLEHGSVRPVESATDYNKKPADLPTETWGPRPRP